ncbi:MAG: amidase [Longimicrobiales bacterium]
MSGPPPQDERVDRRAFLERMGAAVALGSGASLPALETAGSPAQKQRAVSPPPEVDLPQVPDPTEFTLAEAAQAIRERSVSADELCSAYLSRIQQHDPVLKAFNTVPEAEVRARALALDQTPRRGILHGIPLAIKDNYCTEGIATTANSLIFKDYVPDFDATTVDRLKSQGAIIVGKTQMGPLATTRATTPDGTRTTVNAWAADDVSVSPGGSSSGSATAVAARLAASSTGTQTGGSITSPSTAQGLTGLKPTMGRVSLNGVIPLTYTRDHPGPIARDAMDAAVMLQVMAGPDPRDPRTLGLPSVPDYVGAATPVAEGQLRWPVTVGVIPDFLDAAPRQRAGQEPDEQEQAAARARAVARREMLDTFGRLGARTLEVEWPDQWETLTSFHFNNVRLPERTEPFLHYLKEDVRLFGVSLSPWINGLLLSGDEYLKGQRAKLALLDRMLTSFFERCDVVVLDSHLAFDIVGLPLMAFPIGFDDSSGRSLPIGGLIGGKPFGEERLLSLVAGYQAVTDHHKKRAPDPVSQAPGSQPEYPGRLDVFDVDREGQ